MSIPYTSEDFTTPRAEEDSWVEYPFIEKGDNSSKVYHMRCTVNKSDYAPIALDTTMASASNADVLVLPFAADTSAYFVGDFNHRVKDGALLEFDRQFATIPATNDDYTGTEFFTFPGLPAKGTTSSVTFNSNSYADEISTFNTDTNHNMQPGDVFEIFYNFTYNSVNYFRSAYLICIDGTTGTTVKANSIIGSYGLDYSGTYHFISPNKLMPRDAVNLASNVKITNEYYLPGITSNIATINDIPILKPFSPYNQDTGKHTDTLENFNNTPELTTTPTAEDYRALIDAQDYIVKECSIRRYLGNIYVRRTKKIVAR